MDQYGDQPAFGFLNYHCLSNLLSFSELCKTIQLQYYISIIYQQIENARQLVFTDEYPSILLF